METGLDKQHKDLELKDSKCSDLDFNFGIRRTPGGLQSGSFMGATDSRFAVTDKGVVSH